MIKQGLALKLVVDNGSIQQKKVKLIRFAGTAYNDDGSKAQSFTVYAENEFKARFLALSFALDNKVEWKVVKFESEVVTSHLALVA